MLASLVRGMVGWTSVIAEGVECAADLELARDLGVGLVRGFYVGRPVAARALSARLRRA